MTIREEIHRKLESELQRFDLEQFIKLLPDFTAETRHGALENKLDEVNAVISEDAFVATDLPAVFYHGTDGDLTWFMERNHLDTTRAAQILASVKAVGIVSDLLQLEKIRAYKCLPPGSEYNVEWGE